MDAIGLTASIIETGFQVKDSIDTFARRRSHAKALASDVVVDLRRIAEFYETNQSILSYEALGPLRDSLDVLKSDLHRVHKRCQIYEPNKDVPKYKRLVSSIKLWMESDEIEADLVRIKERIQASMNCISLLSGARVEVRVTKIEGILTNGYQSRSRLQQFDSIFTQELVNGAIDLGGFDRLPSDLDYVDIQYIRLKAMKLVATISVANLITDGTSMASSISIYSSLPIKPAVSLRHIISATTDLQALASSVSIPIRELCRNTFYLARMFDQFEPLDINRKILDSVEYRLRQTLRLGTLRLPPSCHIEEEEALDYLELILHYRNYYTSSHACDQPAACSTCDGDTKRASESIQFSRSRLERRASPSNHHRLRFLHSLMPLICSSAVRGRVDECLTYCLEALEVIRPCIASTARGYANVVDAAALQFQVQVLDCLSFAQARDGNYTSAYHTGMECISSLEALSDIDKSQLPNNFDCLPHILEYLQQDMPTWASVVRNPEHRTSKPYIEEYIEENVKSDGSRRQIEWGIAL